MVSHFCVCTSQSRQSAKRFSSRWNWDSPTPFAAGECAPPPGIGTPPPLSPQASVPPHPLVRGGGHTRLRLKGWGSLNSNEGTYTYTVVLYIYKCFVCVHDIDSSVKGIVFRAVCFCILKRGSSGPEDRAKTGNRPHVFLYLNIKTLSLCSIVLCIDRHFLSVREQ